MANPDYRFGYETGSSAKAGHTIADDEEEDELPVLNRKRVSRIDGALPAKELNKQLTLSYVAGRIAPFEKKLAKIREEREGLLAEHRSPKYEGEFQNWLKKTGSESEAREKIAEYARKTLQDAVSEEIYDAVYSSQFYNDMQIEMKAVTKALDKDEAGTVDTEVLKHAVGLYLKMIRDVADKYNTTMSYDEKDVLLDIESTKKAADIEANYGYA